MDDEENVKRAELKRCKKEQRKILKFLAEFNNQVNISVVPTRHLFIGNAGLLNGITRELILTLLSKHGDITSLVMLPHKSFAFASFALSQSALQTVHHLNHYNLRSIGTPACPLFFGYLQNAFESFEANEEYPLQGNFHDIQGLTVFEEFIDSVYEEKLTKFFCCGNSGSSMKHRTVKHFGYEFLYNSNNIDRSKPLEAKIPTICQQLLDKLLTENVIDFVPDQLTVNEYKPGQGIPSHIDTHSVFEDAIISLSLNSQVTMDFKPSLGRTKSVILPRRSLLVLRKDARYSYTHGITPRKNDIVYVTDENSANHLTLHKRATRISLTFRKIRHTPCNCSFKEQCDSQQSSAENDKLLLPSCTQEASDLERKHVVNVYEEIAKHFSDTRHTPWPRVRHFLDNLSPGSLVADVGCGNGKYMGVNRNVFSVGSDRSMNLAEICWQRKFEVCVSDCLKLPYRDSVFDAVICIAVIHHLSTEFRRLEAIQELLRVANKGGHVLIYVWAIEQEEERKVKVNMNEEEEMGKVGTNTSKERQEIAVSQGRNMFQQQDLLIPWHLKQGGISKQVYHRFYHVFVEGELSLLCSKVDCAEIEDVYFDRGNWCIILRKV